MSREGANNRIDSLKNALNTDQYQRSALGNAVRFNTMLNLFDDSLSAEIEGRGINTNTDRFEGSQKSFTRDEFANALEKSVVELRVDFEEQIADELGTTDRKFDNDNTIQQKLQNRAYKTELGQTVAHATVQRKGMYQDFNTSYSTGATGAFRSFTNGFVQDDEDFFGSRVLYDNVFGQYEDGTESLSNRARLAMSDPTNDDRTVSEKVIDNIVNKSIYDQTEIIDRVDIEFGRFHGNSMIDAMSMSGSGLKAARQTIRKVMQEGSAFGRQVQARGSDDHPVTLAQALMDRTGTDLDTANNALNLLNNNLSNRSSTSVASPDSGYVNKAGVAEFIDLINTAGTRDSNGALTGGRISISSFQFQNETISAALSDKIQRHVLESVLQGGGAPLQIDMTLAYPRQRNLNKQEDNDGRYAVGMTNYGILGPNLIEAMKLQEVENNIQDMLIGLGVPKEDIAKYVSLNIQFRDKKFHPKVYFTDNVASIGTQNLTAPVGNSVNQAGSNFETMRFVSNTFKNDTELQEARNNLGLSGPNHIQNNEITQSLLYRQIVNAAEQERTYNQNLEFNRTNGNTSTPILNQDSNSQVGFAGDIYQHISNTLAFAHSDSFESIDGFKPRNLGGSNTHMFMILDQAFMLQLGSTSFGKQLAGEMGAEVGITYEDKDNQTRQYKIQQNRLFDLLIADKANVVVDTKNYNEQVMKPLLNKINARDVNTNELKNSRLVSNFEKHGQSLSMMAGFDLFKPSASQTKSEYDQSLNIMFKELRRLGFSEEAGFDDSDLKQIIGMASGNIEMANVPRQHAKEAALFQYDNSGKAEIISYYQGSSNLGLYSLGIGSGNEGQYQAGDGDLTNTELGIMLGRRDINNNLSRSTQTNLNVSTEFFEGEGIISSSATEWALNDDEELSELIAAQRHFSVTWQQLARTNIDTIHTKKFDSTPSWQDNVNTKDLVVLRNRLEDMAKELGVSSDVFKVTERYGDKSGSGITSINVSIDMNKVMTSSEFARPSSNLPRLNFELSVLQGPSRGEGMFHDSASEGDISGYVYFVDKNRVIGNGLFSNDSGQNITVLGRHNYEDKFENNLQKGRINLKSGQSAHMSSLDIVPQLFATLMGEAVSRFGTASSLKVFDDGPDNADNYNMSSVKELLLDYVAINLTGYSTQIDESIGEGSNIVSSMKQIQDNLDVLSLQDLNETINRHARSIENRMDSSLYDSQDPLQQRKDKQGLSDALGNFNNKWFHHLRQNSKMSENDVHSYINDLHNLVQMSPQLANMVVKTAYKDPNETANRNAFKDFQTLLFGSFLQTNDERTYGGQQGFYKTLLMGLGNSTADKNTASLMFDVDANNPSLRNLGAYARFKPLEYNPLTDIHDVLYRSIASKSTSLLKNDDSLDSMFLESEARDLGDSANLRLISSIGVGNTLYRDDFIKKNESGLIEVGKDQKEIFDSMELAMKASGQSQHSIDLARKAYLDSVAKEFGDLDSEDRNDTVRLSFYTGNSKKLSQLPQRIKNAMGARPMYQFTVEAQMAIERGESLNELSEAYLNKYRNPIVSASKNKVIVLLNEREELVSKYGETDERVTKLDNEIDDLKVIGSKAFNNKVSGLGAIFSGRVKSVLNQEQIDFIVKTKTRLYAAMGDLVESGELSNDALDELVRVEILKAGLTNKGLGKMLAGNNHMNYSMALVQLAGTYNDTFLANPLYGTTYKSKEAYDNIQKLNINIYDPNLDYQDRDNLGVNNLGMKEGHYRTKQQSVKSSMIGAGGMEVLIQNDDIVVEDKTTGNFVHKRKIDGEWKIIGQVDDSRNVQIIKNVVDKTGFSEVGSSGLGSSTASTYGRKGQNSVDYIYNVENRSGNFANNEYLLDISRITALDPSSGQRVEGTDSSALIKGVAVFAGRVKYSSLQNAQGKEQNVFENIEEQIMRSYSQGEIKGSLKSYLDYSDQTQKITLQDGREAYAPLSSSIHGLYNANNFKSFFWSHGATILRSEVVDSQGQKSSFMLDNLFNQDTDSAAIDSAKKIAGAFLVNFGTEFLQDSKDPAKQKEIDILKRSLVSEMIKGSYGNHYQKVVLEQTRGLGDRVNEIFENSELRKGRSKEDITSDLLFKEITKGQAGFNSLKTGSLTALSSSQLSDVLKGDLKASKDLINLVRTGMIDPVANRAKQIGGINFTNSADTQAALLVTAIDLMHQISGKGNQLKIPTDINFDSDKVKDVLLTLIGANKGIDDETTEDIMEFLSGVSSNVPTISVFTDIIFSYSKDPTSTQSVARHEGQHLITPFMGDIQKYQEGGKLSNIQHTVAGITAMVTGQASGMVFYDQMAKQGFKEKTATNLIGEDSDYLFSSFNKQQFLGFYQKGVSGVTTDNFVNEYKLINTDLLEGKYDWDSINVIRDANDKTKISDTDESYLDFDEDGKPGAVNKAHAQVKRFVDKFHANDSELEKARVTDQLLKMGGDKFALHQLNVLTNAMSIENAKYQADTSKSTGRDTVSNLLENMTNTREYFSLPELSFEMQNGEIIARASNTKSLSTMLPSAQEMRVLGAEYSDFVDPVLNHYKNLSSIFVPGTVANTAFEKVRLAARENRAIVLSTEEYKAMAGVMDSARMMIPELQKASAGSRTQEAFGGKEKYQGFTSTGIGNLLVPFDSVALAQSKLDEAGMVENLERFELMRQSDKDIKSIEEDRSYYIADDYKSPSLSRDPWLDSVSGKAIPHSNSIDSKNKPELRSNKLLPSGKYFTQKERFGPSMPITLRDNKEVLSQALPASSLNLDSKNNLSKLIESSEVAPSDLDFLSSKFNQKGIQVNYKSDLQSGVAGEYIPRLGIINIDNNMSASEKASTLLHELVHVYQEKNEIPLWGLQKHSSRANPEIHGSRALDSEVNLKEWQAFSIEKHYEELSQKNSKEATEFLNTVINAFDSGDSDLIKNALGSLGYKSELNDEYKQFTKHDIYSQSEIEDTSFFSKKDNSEIIPTSNNNLTESNKVFDADIAIKSSDDILEYARKFGYRPIETPSDKRRNQLGGVIVPSDKQKRNVLTKVFHARKVEHEYRKEGEEVTLSEEDRFNILSHELMHVLQYEGVIPMFGNKEMSEIIEPGNNKWNGTKGDIANSTNGLMEWQAYSIDGFLSELTALNTIKDARSRGLGNSPEIQALVRRYGDPDAAGFEIITPQAWMNKLMQVSASGNKAEVMDFVNQYGMGEDVSSDFSKFDPRINGELIPESEIQLDQYGQRKENHWLSRVAEPSSVKNTFQSSDTTKGKLGGRNYMGYGRLDIGPYGYENLTTLQSIAGSEENGKLIGTLGEKTLDALKEMEDYRDFYANEFAERTGVSLNTAYEFLDKRITKLKDLIDPNVTVPVKKLIENTEPRIIDNPEVKTPTSELPKNSNNNSNTIVDKAENSSFPSQKQLFFDQAEVTVDGNTFIYSEEAGSWKYAISDEFARTANAGTDILLNANLFRLTGLRNTLQAQLEKTSDGNKQKLLQKQIDIYNLRIQKSEERLIRIEEEFNKQYSTSEITKEVKQSTNQVLDSATVKDTNQVLDSTTVKDINPLGKNIINFYRRQKAAEAFGISKSLEQDFKNMKKEAIAVKNKILDFAEIDGLPEAEKRAAFNTLYEEIKTKRDIAYRMSSLDESTGDSISNKNSEYAKNIPSEADRYIYHAQALNYDSLLAQLSIIGHQANLRPLTEQNVKEIETKAKQLSTIKFLLNSNEDAQGASTFIGLSHKQSNLSEGALFTNKALSEGGGMVGQHMKNIESLSSELRGLGMGAEAKQVKTQYALQQIEATIQMYEKRMADMQAFSAERSVHSSKKDAQGNPLIDEKVQRNIDTASEQYNRNTLEVISYLKDKKAKLLSQPVNNDQVIRNTFEDIDVKIAEVDTANIYLAEVFRSPPPGGTDPRIHTYRVMQGVSALNQLSQSLSDNKEIGAENRMIYSTERGQTATMLASLGVVTLGGGDYDGDPYTVIFHQASKAQSAVDEYKGRITQNELLIKSFNNEITELQNQVRGLDPKNSNALKQRDQLEARITTLIERKAEKQNRLIQDSSDLQEAKSNLERQITDGHRGLQARARKQVANYLGMDERLFVSSNEIMFDTKGKAILNEDGVEQKGLNSEKTYDADALVVLLEKGYNLMDGVQSSHKTIMGIMDSIDILTGYRSEPEAFRDGKFIEELTSRENLVSSPNGKISAESPAIGMLKARVAKFQANMEQLTPDQKQFVNSLKDAPVERYIAYLEQFRSMQTEMDKAISLHNLENQQKAEGLQKDFSRRAFMNQWIGGELYNTIVADKTLGKFMTQGVGMTLTEGTFDMTLKTLGKAGGEVLGKTYNTIIGTTFQDAPIISYGRQILDKESELHKATLSEFQKQAEGNSEKREKVIEELKAQGIEKNHPDFNKLVSEKTRALGYEEFDNYVKVTQKAVLKSEGTQGFMKNIHQLLRDSIKLKSDGDLLGTLQESSENYDKLSKQIAANDEGAKDDGVKQALIRERDAIIGGMSSKLGPGPGLKSLIDLDYLTNESSKTGLSRTDFESRFLTVGGIDSNRQMLNHYAESMTNLTEEERRHLTDPSTIGEESSALLKVARNMTAQNLANIVTSFRMEATAVEGRTDLIKGFARDHKAKLATELGHHSVTDTPRSVMQDGIVEQEDQTGKYIQEKYGIIESENSAGRFDANRQHKNALGAHLGIEEAHIYNEDGTMSDAYRNKLEDASKKLNISSEEYTLMFDIHHETSREQVKGVFGEDGKEMEQFTVMNMMRKNIARSMLDGQIPSAEASKTINESMGSEVLTTMAQLAAQNKLDSKGMEMFSGMYKGVVGHLLDATDGVVEYVDKSQIDAEGNVISKRKTMKFSEMNAQQKGAYMTKLLHQTMLGTEVSQESGFTRSTSQEARDFKTINARVIANSDLEMDANGRLTNDFIDALDKAGANTLTGQQQEMYDAMSAEFVRSALDSDEQFDSVMRMALPTRGDSVPGRKSDAEYRTQMKRKVREQIKIRQEQDAQKYASSRSRHGQSQSVMNRSSFMNKIDGSALDQLTTTAGSNVLDLFVPLALTAIGGGIQSGSIDNEELMQLGGAAFTAFQYARTGTIESTQMDPTSYKKKLLGASAVGGIFKFKNALAQQGDENVGMAVAQIAVQEVTAASFNAIATPWLSKNIAEHGLGVKHAPAMNALDMQKYQAGQQLAGNIGASLISALSSTLISGLLMRGVESMSENVGQAIQSFLPAVQAVNSVNEAIAKKRQQESAYQDFEAETDNSEGQISDYMVITDATYNPDNYASMSDLQEEQELEPSNDGSLSIGLLN